MKLFLSLKHWHIFFLILLFALFYASFFCYNTVMDLSGTFLSDWAFLVCTYGVLIASILSSLVATLIWICCVGLGLQQDTPSDLQKNTIAFKIAIFFLLATSITLFFYPIYVALYGSTELFFEIFLYVFGASFLGLPYCIYFAAQTLRTAVLQRKPKFKEFFIEMCLIIAFPIGLWMLQPKVNNVLYKVSKSSEHLV